MFRQVVAKRLRKIRHVLELKLASLVNPLDYLGPVIRLLTQLGEKISHPELVQVEQIRLLWDVFHCAVRTEFPKTLKLNYWRKSPVLTGKTGASLSLAGSAYNRVAGH